MPSFSLPLSNKGEARVDNLISARAERHGAKIYRKMRIADAIGDIKVLDSPELRGLGFAGHFDWVVTDVDHLPQFAMEFDGTGHDSRNDHLKDELCRRAGLALFRVSPPSAFIIKPAAFVGFIVDTWFGLKEFLAMKAKGELPADEPFMMSGFLKPDAKHIFDTEFDFVSAARSRLARLLGTPVFEHASISMIGPNGEYVAFAQYGKFYGRARIVFRAITWGAFEDYAPALARELGEFCHALAYEDLRDEVELGRVNPQVRRRDHEVREEIADLKTQGFQTALSLCTKHGPEKSARLGEHSEFPHHDLEESADDTDHLNDKPDDDDFDRSCKAFLRGLNNDPDPNGKLKETADEIDHLAGKPDLTPEHAANLRQWAAMLRKLIPWRRIPPRPDMGPEAH